MRSSDESRVWYVQHAGRRYGPETHGDLLRAADAGWLQPDDLVWWPGFEKWRTARDVAGLLGAADIPPAAEVPAAEEIAPGAPSSRSPSATGQPSGPPRASAQPDARAPAPGADRPAIAWRRKAYRGAIAWRRRARRWKVAVRRGLAPARAYLARHWRGELPLVRAFWLNTVLLFLAIQLAFKYLLTVATRTPGAADAVYAAYLALLATALLWMFVGVWRAAERRKAGRGPLSWPAVAQGCIVLWGLAIAATLAQALGQAHYAEVDPSAGPAQQRTAAPASPGASLKTTTRMRASGDRTADLAAEGSRKPALPQAKPVKDLVGDPWTSVVEITTYDKNDKPTSTRVGF